MSALDFRRTSTFLKAVALLAAAFLLPLSQAAAQQQPDRDARQGEEIVVTGVREQLRAIENYVRGLTVAGSDDPLSRYEPGVFCPTVLGLSGPRNAEIARRMRRVAAAAGVEPAGANCRTSALVIFVDDKESFLAAFQRRHPVYFTGLRGEALPPPREDGPAVAWQLVQNLDPQGNPVQRDGESGFGIVSSPMGGSRLLSMIRPVVAMTVVVVERRGLIGLTPTQIADYVLMRTLTDRGPARLQVPDQLTILKALTAPIGTAVPASLTQWDLAYLRGRYSGNPARYGGSQRSAIRRTMRRAVTDGNRD